MNGGWMFAVANVERGEDGRDVRAGAEERDVAEVEQAGQSDDDVQAHRRRRRR